MHGFASVYRRRANVRASYNYLSPIGSAVMQNEEPPREIINVWLSICVCVCVRACVCVCLCTIR